MKAPTFRAYVRRTGPNTWQWQTRIPLVAHRTGAHQGEAYSQAQAWQTALSNAAFWQPNK